MFHSPSTTEERRLEIVTPEWQYFDTDEYNFDEAKVVPVKEQRRMGTQRGNKTTPQAPALEVRAKGLPTTVPVACRCRLWNFGSCTEREPPKHDGSATQLTTLRANVQIEVTENVAVFGPVQEDGYRYARLRCFITRGARVQCRKFHIAFLIDCVYLPPGSAAPGPDDSSFAVGEPVEDFPWTRSARMSISEKAMCPRSHDKFKRKQKKEADTSLDFSPTKKQKKTAPLLNDDPNLLTPTGRAPSTAGSAGQKPSSSAKKDIQINQQQQQQQQQQALSSMMFQSQYNGLPYLDRHMRISRFSFPGLEDEMFQHAPVGDEGDLASMESALNQGRRPSNFVNPSYWPYQTQHPSLYLNQSQGSTGMVPPSQGNSNPVSNSGGSNGHPLGNGNGQSAPAGTASPLLQQAPHFSNLQPGFSIDFGLNGVELSQRRLSSGGPWGSEISGRRVSSTNPDVISRLSGSPLPPNQPGRGPEWEALFEAHAKVLSLDKNSPDYLTKKTAAMAEVYRCAELVEQRITKS